MFTDKLSKMVAGSENLLLYLKFEIELLTYDRD